MQQDTPELFFTPTEQERTRAWELVSREKAGELTLEEKAELDYYVQLEHFMRLTKARARQILSAE